MDNMRKYLKRLGESHAELMTKLLAKREVSTLAEVADGDLFAFGEEMRREANLPSGFAMARARGLSLEADPLDDEIEVEGKPVSTAQAINSIAVALYEKADNGSSLIDAVPPGSSTREALGFMATAHYTLAKRGL